MTYWTAAAACANITEQLADKLSPWSNSESAWKYTQINSKG
jgi:hypothetical protein